jgi:hypothetical protein
MIHFFEKFHRSQMRVDQQISEPVYGASGNIDAMENLKPFMVAARRELLGQKLADSLGIARTAFL